MCIGTKNKNTCTECVILRVYVMISSVRNQCPVISFACKMRLRMHHVYQCGRLSHV